MDIVRFWMGVFLIAIVTLGLSTESLASPEVCQNLSRLSKGAASSAEVRECQNKTRGAWYDFVALMICRDLDKISSKGARPAEITKCLTDISKKRFKYSRLKQCKKTHRNPDLVRRCIRRSEV